MQGAEAVLLMRQLAGWLDGQIEAVVLEQRIQAQAAADAAERARRTGFG